MARIAIVVNLVLVLMGLSSCGNLKSNTETVKAPRNNEEAHSRVIVKGSQVDTQKLIDMSQSYRVISAKHNIYEIQGLSLQEIKDLTPLVSAERNQFIQIFKQNHLQETKTLSAKKFLALAEEEQATELPPIFAGCNLDAPQTAQIGLIALTDILAESATMNLGETATFGSQVTLPSVPNAQLEVRWEVLPSEGSSLEFDIHVGPTLSITPDAVGLYHMRIVAKASDNSCGVRIVRFVVTHNPVIEFAQENEEQPTVDINNFTHLAKINTPQAWESVTGQGVMIAVLDSGLHYNHPAIKFNLAFNQAEREGLEGEDDDQNQFADDLLGWDFVNNDNLPFDDDGHGSHVGGLTSAHTHGVAPGSSLLPVKVMAASGGGDLASIIGGMYYAVDRGAKIINASLGGFLPASQELLDAVAYMQAHNVVFVAAAGNNGVDLSLPGIEFMPAEIDSPNLISVAASGHDNALTSYSNFGKLETDVAAPGGDEEEPIYSLATLNTRDALFIGLVGTSMAVPIVAGVAALVLQANPELNPEQVRQILMTSGQDVAALSDKVGSGKIIDAAVAVEKAEALLLPNLAAQ